MAVLQRCTAWRSRSARPRPGRLSEAVPILRARRSAALLPDPTAEDSFLRSKLDFSEPRGDAAAYALHRDLLRLRRDLRPHEIHLEGETLGPDLLFLRYQPAAEETKLLVVNFGIDQSLASIAQPLIAPPAETTGKSNGPARIHDTAAAGPRARHPRRLAHSGRIGGAFFSSTKKLRGFMSTAPRAAMQANGQGTESDTAALRRGLGFGQRPDPGCFLRRAHVSAVFPGRSRTREFRGRQADALVERRGAHNPERLVGWEWLLTNGLGGYASGTVAWQATRRYHGLLIAALPAPLGRVMMFNDVVEDFVCPITA